MEIVESRNILIFQKKNISWRMMLFQEKKDPKEWQDNNPHQETQQKINNQHTNRNIA